LSLLLFTFFALASRAVAQVSLSFAPVLDYSALEDPPETVVLRNSIIAELTESYNCVILSRSNGIALLEEQRSLAYSSVNLENFSYPPSADFFGCEFIIRPTIPTPKSRAIYSSDLTSYKRVPLLRHLISVRPAPQDAINQLFIVDRPFHYSNHPYNLGLGTIISTAWVQQHLPSRRKPNRIAAMIIRSFRYYVERSQGIFLEESPDSKPCINAKRGTSIEFEISYCPECVKNYMSADWKAVHAFVQELPLEIAFKPDYIDRRNIITEEEKESIQNYINELQAAY